MKRFKPAALVAVVVAAVALTGCKPEEYDAIDYAKRAVEHSLIDPDSAQFTGVQFYNHTPASDAKTRLIGTVCGKVNAKNRMGGYTGAKDFYAAVNMTSDQNQLTAFAIEPATTRSYSSGDQFRKQYYALCTYKDVR